MSAVVTDKTESKSLGAFKTSKALFYLYETAAPNLSRAELEFMARAINSAQLQAENMTEIVDGLATLIANDNNVGAFNGRIPELLWQLSYQFDLIAGLIELGDSALYRLNNPDKQQA